MVFRKLITCILFVAAGHLQAQNLVPNSGFEECIGAPHSSGQLDVVTHWLSGNQNVTDYYHVNGGWGVGIPDNQYGIADAHEGNAYAGIFCFSEKTNLRSYLAVRLAEPLEAGRNYDCSFYYSLADRSLFAINELHVSFSNRLVMCQGGGPCTDMSNVKALTSEEGFEEMSDWERISVTYLARGGEQYLMLGNFHPDAMTYRKQAQAYYDKEEFVPCAYYYIDDVSVTLLPESKQTAEKEDDIFGSGVDTTFFPALVFRKGDEVFFPSSGYALQSVINRMQDSPELHLEITGYAGRQSSAEKQERLPQFRANSVARYLERKGISSDRVTSGAGIPEIPLWQQDMDSGVPGRNRIRLRLYSQ